MKQKGFALVLIIFVLAVIGVAGYFAYRYFGPTIYPSYQPASTSTTTVPSMTSTPVPSPLTASKIYLVKFTLKSDNNPPPIWDYPNAKYRLSEYIEILLQLPVKSISSVLFDTRSGSPYAMDNAVFKRPYYIVLNQPVKLNPTYSDQYITAVTETFGDSILPYLIKNDYCEKDSDCSIRSAMCTMGAFNYFQTYADPPWGCGPAGYKDNFSWFEYGTHDSEFNCDLDSLEFDGAKCENHTCTETGYKKVCIK